MDIEQTPAPAEQEPIAQEPSLATTEPQELPEPSEPVSRQDAIKRAFDKMDEGEATEAKTEATDDRPRGPDGKFVAKDGTEAPVEAKTEAPEADKPPAEAKTPEAVEEPPSRFSADAKAAWKDAPAPVRGEINRAVREMEAGLAEKDQVIAPLKPYLDMAKSHGVQLDQAMGRYVAMEQLLAKDPIRGIEQIAHNFGMTLEQLGAKITGKEPEQGRSDDQRTIMELRQEIDGLKAQFGGVTQTVQQQQQNLIMDQVTAFAAEKPRFDELSGEIKRLLETGYAPDLASAYDLAERLNPAPTVSTPETPPAPPQQRTPKSVTGAPSSGSNPVAKKAGDTRMGSIAHAFEQVGL